MLSIMASRFWIRPYGKLGLLDVLLILAGIFLAVFLRPVSGDWGWL